jgi:hypothetical protein
MNASILSKEMNISYSFQELSSVFAGISAHVSFGLANHGLHIFP